MSSFPSVSRLAVLKRSRKKPAQVSNGQLGEQNLSDKRTPGRGRTNSSGQAPRLTSWATLQSTTNREHFASANGAPHKLFDDSELSFAGHNGDPKISPAPHRASRGPLLGHNIGTVLPHAHKSHLSQARHRSGQFYGLPNSISCHWLPDLSTLLSWHHVFV